MNRQIFVEQIKTATPMSEQQIHKIIVDSINSTDFNGIHLIIAMEELAELAQEISKMLRGKGDINGLLEEVADVETMVYYLKEIFKITDDDIQKALSVKLNRLASKIYGKEAAHDTET